MGRGTLFINNYYIMYAITITYAIHTYALPGDRAQDATGTRPHSLAGETAVGSSEQNSAKIYGLNYVPIRYILRIYKTCYSDLVAEHTVRCMLP